MMGVALRIAASRISRPGRPAWASARASAWRRIRSARFCLPPFISLALNRAVMRLAGTTSYLVLRGMLVRRGISGPLLGLRAVLAATLLAVADAGGIEGAADDVVLDRREVLHPAAADEDDGVLLEVVADAGDVGRDLHLVGQPDARDLAQRRVRLLGRHRPDLQAHAPLLGGTRDRHLAASQAVPVLAHGGRLDLRDLALAPVAHELADRRHEDVVLSVVVRCMRGRHRPRGPVQRHRASTPQGGSVGTGCCGGVEMVLGAGRRRLTPPEATKAESSSGPKRVSNACRAAAGCSAGGPGSALPVAVGGADGFGHEGVGEVLVGVAGGVAVGSQEGVGEVVIGLAIATPGDRGSERKAGRLLVRGPAVALLEERVELVLAEPIERLAGKGLEGSLPLACLAGRDIGRSPGPAGMSLPMMTFSLRPIRWSLAPLMAASVSTRVVSWKDAAARKDEVFRDALVTPRSTVWAVAGSPPSDRTLLFSSSKSSRSISSVGRRSTSPGWSIRTFRSICRTMISMCLSLIVTPWLR